jgi:hypothetical protein
MGAVRFASPQCYHGGFELCVALQCRIRYRTYPPTGLHMHLHAAWYQQRTNCKIIACTSNTCKPCRTGRSTACCMLLHS